MANEISTVKVVNASVPDGFMIVNEHDLTDEMVLSDAKAEATRRKKMKSAAAAAEQAAMVEAAVTAAEQAAQAQTTAE